MPARSEPPQVGSPFRVETICTGDELLTGLTSDTNSRYFQEQLLDRTGLTVRRSVVVGDVREDIIEALNAAAARCDAVLVSGGLGPTTDDLTAECAATAAGVKLVMNDAAMKHIEARFKARNIALSENNRRQAMVPDQCEVVLNAEGSAPLFIQKRGNCTLFFVPGVPREYRHLVGAHVVARIAALSGKQTFRKLALLKTVGLPESHLDARVKALHEKYPRVTLGFRTHPPENHLKLLAEGDDADSASKLLEQVTEEARGLLGATCFARDDETMASVVLEALVARREFLAVAESCTGGMIAESLTSVSGSSRAFYGGACTYLEDAKAKLAQVPEGLMAQFGVVSSETAEAMATGLRQFTGVQWALSTTGYAGPTGGDAENPVGTVFIGISGPGITKVERHHFHGDRDRVRAFATWAALDLLRRSLQTVQGTRS
ncbi:MAG: CinA family nicotinamide mononucleotide deamidase-related protein [Archangium sp.]|nr:CinA family nicotinamide mononucleotide deamidase-related protein [Archangium sp.]